MDMKKFIEKNRFVIWLFVISFLLRLIVITIVNTPLESDFKTMFEASRELINGTSMYKSSPYFLSWGYQMGHVIYQYLLLNIINSTIFLKIINALITSFIVVFIYLISKKISNEKSAKIVSIFYMIIPFPLLLNTVLTNQHFPILLTLIALYLLLNIDYNKKILGRSFLIGLFLCIANILRSEGIIIILSIFLYSIILLIKKYNLKKVILSFITIVATYYILFNIASTLLIKTDVSINGLKNMNPTWKFVVGLNYDTNGMYSEEDASIYSSIDSIDNAKIEIKNRLKQIDKLPILLLKKIKVLWFNSDLSWSLKDINISYRVLDIFNIICIYSLNILLLLTLFCLRKIKNITMIEWLFLIIILGYFGVYLFIEVMPRYAYSTQVFSIILCSVFIKKMLKNN